MADRFVRSLFAQLAIQDKRQRAEYERRYNVKIDWDRVERTDRKISQSLKEVLPTIDSGAKP